jgi:hypothetical protein
MFPDRSFTRRVLATALMLTWGASTTTGAGDAFTDFTKTWNGRRVVVRSELYTVLYDEVGRLGRHYRGKRAGLTIATPADQYYEFDGPGSDDDIVESTPNGVMSRMSEGFHRSNYLDLSAVKTVTPLVLRQYAPGVTLIVDSVKMEQKRNRIRIEFRQAGHEQDGVATSLTVEWHAPFSDIFREREAIEGVIRRFVHPLQQRAAGPW